MTRNNVMVMYDSGFGNTAKIAEAVAKGLGISATHIKDVAPGSFDNLKLLVVGSPTQGGTSTQALRDYLAELPAGSLRDMKVAGFDTRFAIEDQKLWLRLLMNAIDYAAPKIVKSLAEKGGVAVGKPMGFIVGGREGPLRDGEIDRARAWGELLLRA